jgi:hypothetical protein
MGYTKRTSRTVGGVRTTTTKTITNKGNTRHTTSKSTGSTKNGATRYTASTNINSGSRTKQYATRVTPLGRKTVLLNPITKFKKTRSKIYKHKKSKPLGIMGWSILAIIIILLANS